MPNTPTTRRRRAPSLGEEVMCIDRWTCHDAARVIGIYPDGWRVESTGDEKFFDVRARHPNCFERSLFVLAEGTDPVGEGDQDDRLLRPGVKGFFITELGCADAVVEAVVSDGFLARIDEGDEGRGEWDETRDALVGCSTSEAKVWLPAEYPSPCPPDGEMLVIPTADRWYLGEHVDADWRDYEPWDDDPPLALGHPFLIDDDPDQFRRFSMQADAARAACNRPERFVEGGPEAWREARFGRTGRPSRCRWRADLPADFIELLNVCHNSDLTHDAKHAHCVRLIADLRAGRRTLTVPAGGPFVRHALPHGAPVVQSPAPDVAI